MANRIGWDAYFFGICEAVSRRADCTRRQVGAVIVDTDRRLVAAGYNGAPPGAKGCLTDAACPRGRHYRKIVLSAGSSQMYACACGNGWPCDESALPGSSYDTGAGACTSIHAELNAILDARCPVKGFTMYCTDDPCDGCVRAMKGAQLLSVKWPAGSLSLLS
jgi:dCMP deaminase